MVGEGGGGGGWKGGKEAWVGGRGRGALREFAGGAGGLVGSIVDVAWDLLGCPGALREFVGNLFMICEILAGAWGVALVFLGSSGNTIKNAWEMQNSCNLQHKSQFWGLQAAFLETLKKHYCGPTRAPTNPNKSATILCKSFPTPPRVLQGFLACPPSLPKAYPTPGQKIQIRGLRESSQASASKKHHSAQASISMSACPFECGSMLFSGRRCCQAPLIAVSI